MRTGGCRVKPISEILRFVGHQTFAKFHDAHCVRRYAVIGKHEFSDPEIAAADNSPNCKTLLVLAEQSDFLGWSAGREFARPIADNQARHLAVDLMFGIEIVRVRSLRGSGCCP